MLTTVAESAKVALLAELHYLTERDVARVANASEYADEAHKLVVRKSGEPYILHPIAVAMILSELKVDAETLCAALLHDVIEDTEITRAEIAERFGEKVAELVDGVTKLKASHDKHSDKLASLRKILMATLQEPRVMIIKLADRLHNMSTLGSLKPEKRLRIAKETMDIFIPMAKLVGLNLIGDKLETLALEHLEPEMFTILQNTLANAKAERDLARHNWQKTLNNLVVTISANLPVPIRAEVISVNNDHDVYRKFFKHESSISELLETHAFHIILDQIKDCHLLADHLEQQFNWSERLDHIRNPLPGGKQALLLELKDDFGSLSISIQTKRMQQAGSLGIVMGDTAPETSRSVIQASLANLSNYLDHTTKPQDANNTEQLMLGIIQHLHHKKVLVYTPTGDTHELPKGASVIDFAYAASLYLGNHAVEAFIDGEKKPLATVLKNGQTVKLVTHEYATPNPDWLSFVNTPKARHAIQKRLTTLSVEEQRQIGKQTLTRALAIQDCNIDDLTPEDWQKILLWQHLDTPEQLFEQIATGDVLPQFVASRHIYSSTENNVDLHTNQLIKGTYGVETRFAQCCTPILGDPILGHLTKRGLVIHRVRCQNLLAEQAKNPSHVVGLEWQEDMSDDPRFTVKLECDTTMTEEQTTDLIYLIQEMKAGLERLNLNENSTTITVIVRDRNHLAKVIKGIRVFLNFPKVSRELIA